MREMRDSGIPWIGDIPKDWETCQVKNIFAISRGRVIPITDMDDSYPYPVYSSQTKDNGCMGYIPTFDYEGEALTWTTDGANAGTVFYRFGKFNCTNVCGVLQLKIRDSLINYMLYSVGHSAFHCRRADTNGYKIMSNEMAEIKIAVPPLAEQQRIAEFLDRKCAEVDEMIGLQEQIIEELKAYKQSVITEAVTKGLNPAAPMRDSGIEWIGQIPEHWEVCRIKNAASLFGRIGFRGYTSDDLNKDGEGAITLSPSNMLPMGMDYSSVTYLSWAKYYESPEIQIQNGDILMVKTGSSYGKVSYVDNLPREATINPQILRIVSKINSKYLGYYLQTPLFIYQVEGGVVGGTIPTISQEKINNFFIVASPTQEQKAIANYLDEKCADIDSLIQTKQSKIDSLKEYKKSIIYEYVTGKREVE